MIKLFFLLQIILSGVLPPGWLTDFEIAKKTAVEKNQFILLNFSGSDWCGPCIRLRKEYFESPDFKNYAPGHIVLLNADFPRQKKNKIEEEQVAKNEKLAEKYNKEGKFPYSLLLNKQGDVIKTWDGIPEGKPAQFVMQIRQICETAR